MNELITITQPNGDEVTAKEMYAYLMRREAEIKAEYAPIEARLDGDDWQTTKDDWSRLNAMDDEIKAAIKATEKAAMAYSQADRVIVQLKAMRKSLAEIHDRAWAKYCELRDADKPKPTPSLWLIELNATEKDAMAIVTAALKRIGRDDVNWGRASTDDAFATAKAAMKKMEK